MAKGRTVMRLMLMRHGEAAYSAPTDAQRPLTMAGALRSLRTGQWMAQTGIGPGLVLHSPLLRARQTAEQLVEGLATSLTADAEREWLGPGLSEDALLQTAREQASTASVAESSLLVVGHQPQISVVAGRLVNGGSILFEPGTVACIQFSGKIAAERGRLEWVLSPYFFSDANNVE
ncbi:phosphohistidine phosphatase SixA [Thalassoroseus pseudoceratinae]|uniref:phosphohistidine phosphatase SixA n=1 Tax=Thalassoroseus pseudoceratinae TaxID=2713176 RepID=UPI001421A290|nr:phosphohistidine phosphatase SixA [Thalassoroseus pseudoceratinae]